MLISHKWLSKYLPELDKYSKEEIAEGLSASLAEVEEITHVREELNNVVVAEVLSVEKHPNSDKLSLCEVTTNGEDRIQIVCGAPNVAANTKVALCLPGGSVYADSKKNVIKIETTKIRDVESAGMLCSPRELGIGKDHSGILILEDDIEIGADLAEMLQDFVYEVENKSISHRGDCFSHRGIARELSAIFSIEFIEDDMSAETLTPSGEKKELNIEINVDEKLCSRFSALLIENLQVKPSPIWMQARLSAVGERPINNIVDITNYVMLDYGQPLHAYDYDKLAGNKSLTVRKAREEEVVTTLDEMERKLDKEMVVVADSETVEGIAGIMGGLKSSVTKDTKTLILEAATWEMFNIRKSSRTLGLRSEASTRFEKGQDPNLTLPAIQNAFILLSDLGNAELAADKFDYYPSPREIREIELDINHINRMLSLSLTKLEIIEILEKLQIQSFSNEPTDGTNPNQESSDVILVKIPTFRPDLNITEDLVEEVARIYGFSNLPPKLPQRDLTPPKVYEVSKLIRQLTTRLTALGSDEIKSYSFIGSQDFKNSNLNENEALKIKNPIAPELSVFRTSIVPSLLKVAESNQDSVERFSIFEISRAVQKETDQDGLHVQPWQIALLDNRFEGDDAFSNIKAMLENLSILLNVPFKYQQARKSSWPTANLYHPYKFGLITIEDKHLGVFGVLSPEIASNFSLRGDYGLFELNLDTLLEFTNKPVVYKPLTIFPEITRDLSFWIPQGLLFSEISDLVNSENYTLLKNLQVKDMYRLEDKKSITLSLSFQSTEKTLTDSEIDTIVSEITDTLAKKLKLEIREE